MNEGIPEQPSLEVPPQADILHEAMMAAEGEPETITDSPWAIVDAEGNMIGVKDLPQDASPEDRKEWQFVTDMFAKGKHFNGSAE
jgi:hypothetical protein